MNIRSRLLAGSASFLVLASAAAPALAADATDSTSTVGELVVTGIRASLQKAIELKKLNENQIDAISSEDIGKLPDHNVADALRLRRDGGTAKSAMRLFTYSITYVTVIFAAMAVDVFVHVH